MNAVAFAIACLLAGVAQANREPNRVGRIVIEGNTETPDWFILCFVDLRPGQILLHSGLDESRKRLAATRQFDPNDPPTVEVLPGELDPTFKDVRIRVKERPGGGRGFALLDVVQSGAAVPMRAVWQTARAVVEMLKPGRRG